MVRDMTSKAVLCTDLAAKKAHQASKAARMAEKHRDERLHRLEQEVSDMKTLLDRLVQKLGA